MKDPERGWRDALLGRYSCQAYARRSGLKAGSDGNDLEPVAVTCVVLRGSAFAVRLRGERGRNYYQFYGRFAPEEWEDWERGFIEPCVTSAGLVYIVDPMNEKSPCTTCICGQQ